MKCCTLLAGIDGVGKSSFLGVWKEHATELGTIIDVDKLTAEIGGSPLSGGKLALKKIRQCITLGLSFTQETTLSGYKTEATIKEVRDLGYRVRLYYIALDSAEESLARIKNRVYRGGHDIPQNDVERRFRQRWEAVTKILPYCDEAEFYDNDNGFVKVGEFRNGELRPVGEHHPRWFTELQHHLKNS